MLTFLQEKSIISDAARKKERELAQKEVRGRPKIINLLFARER